MNPAVHTCALCGYSWTPRVPNPVMCPQCHTSKWRGTDGEGRTVREAPALPAAPRLTCTRCGNEWTPRSGTPPKVCPKCNTRFWNQPRKRNIPERMRARQRSAATVPAAAKPPAPKPGGGVFHVRSECPHCGGSLDVPVHLLACSKCGAQWVQTGKAPPVRCPQCGQKRWEEGWEHPREESLTLEPGEAARESPGGLFLRP